MKYLRCFLGLHQFDIHKEYESSIITRDMEGLEDVIGKDYTIVQICQHCGKIRITRYKA